jgi:mannose/fructose/N-acetylgalactosamine-specific phosphotransferase system component IID
MNKKALFLRSFLYQGNWNHENMQGTGFKYLLEEFKESNNIDVKDSDLEKEAEYFNTHPFFITFIIGVWIKEYLTNGDPDYYKKVYSSAFAALGDSFIWHSLRPFAFIISVLIGMYNPVFGIIVYLLIFNLFHILFLYIGFDVGYELGKEVISWFNRIKLNKWSSYFDIITVFLTGIFLSKFIKTFGHFNVEYYAIATIFLFVGFLIGKKIDIIYGFILSVIVCAVLLMVLGV